MYQSMLFILLLVLNGPVNAAPLKLLDSYPTFAGSELELQKIIGKKPIYLKFWASWCLDCRRELPSLEKSYQRYKNDIEMFAVNLNINESDAAIKILLQESGLTMPIVMDQNGSIASNFHFVGTPFHVLINASGKVIYTSYKDDARLAAKLQQLASSDITMSEDMLPNVSAKEPSNSKTPKLTPSNEPVSFVYFSATWCDSYMVEVDQSIANNCINAIHTMNSLYQYHPNLTLAAYVTHLWTQNQDLIDYKLRLNINYVVEVDQDNQLFQYYKGTGYPTLIVLKDGQEVARFTEFENNELVLNALKHYLQP
jgi:thiol-disulfide isomerase/thioredoxin